MLDQPPKKKNISQKFNDAQRKGWEGTKHLWKNEGAHGTKLLQGALVGMAVMTGMAGVGLAAVVLIAAAGYVGYRAYPKEPEPEQPTDNVAPPSPPASRP